MDPALLRHEQWQRADSGGVAGVDELLQHTQTVGAVAVDCEGTLAAGAPTSGWAASATRPSSAQVGGREGVGVLSRR